MSNGLPDEYTEVEAPLIAQLVAMRWGYLTGDVHDPGRTERESFRDVLLRDRLRDALRRINRDDDDRPWLDDTRVDVAAERLERLRSVRLMEANQEATELLLTGVTVEGDPERHGGREQTIHFIDWEHPERNDFLVVNQFRVDVPGRKGYIVPDVVLFVNGIPLVVVECKSPGSTDPMEAGIGQLHRYTNQGEWADAKEGAERLFHYNQILVSTWFHEARAGTVGALHEHYMEWKTTHPVSPEQVREEVGKERLSSQHTLVAGMLRPAHLLDLVRNFTLFTEASGRTVKLVARYPQFRTVHRAVERLRTGKTRARHGTLDRRGGIVWHTQGSGKSLTLVFLVRKMRTLPDLRRFKVVVVTDRTDLERQLGRTAALTGETVRRARSTKRLKKLLRAEGPDLVFATIQKYRPDEPRTARKEGTTRFVTGEARRAAERAAGYAAGRPSTFPTLNLSEEIVVLVDEAHRSHSNTLHAHLDQALPNAAMIGFTGTPILVGEKQRTERIFGDFIDRYTLQESEADGATLPILYEGRTADAAVADGRTLDQLFGDMFRERTPAEMEAIRRKYATRGNVLEARRLIAAKAEDMLRHYVSHVLPGGFKAQVVAVSRRAAVRYQGAFAAAHRRLVAALERLDPAWLERDAYDLDGVPPEVQFLVRAHPHLETIRRLEFAAVVSEGTKKRPEWKEWTDPARQEELVERFRKPLHHPDPTKRDGLAFLCVRTMLLTGFDAPVEQVLYLDRGMRGHELLQAIARVNRTHPGKRHGYVVDYNGVARHLHEALEMYSAEDVRGVMTSLLDELPRLADRHREALDVFRGRGIPDIRDSEACILLLEDERIRAEFVVKLRRFLAALDAVLPRREALPYVQDARLLGYINRAAGNLYRDPQLSLAGAGRKVGELIDRYVEARGIDPRVPPISILDRDFERAVDAHVSSRAKASEMEHAARYHITQHFAEDPAYYRRLSERLEEILRSFRENWEELIPALKAFTREVREGRLVDETGLDPRTHAPFYGILLEALTANGPVAQERQQQLVRLTAEMVEHIRREVAAVDFWRSAHAQNELRRWVVRFLDRNDEVIPFRRQQAVADAVVDLAKALHDRLVP